MPCCGIGTSTPTILDRIHPRSNRNDSDPTRHRRNGHTVCPATAVHRFGDTVIIALLTALTTAPTISTATAQQ
jgi:hypothetical protein